MPDTDATDSPGMIQHRGIWLPAGETHLQPHLDRGDMVDGRGTYQLHKLVEAVNLCPPDRRRVAVDVGAHVGLWTRILARAFATVHAFEPVPWFRACWARNLQEHSNARLHPYALSDEYTELRLRLDPTNSGSTRVDHEGGELAVQTMRLDDMRLHEVDLIKLDCEGWEEPALRGAVDTLQRCRPVVIVEQKPGHQQRAGLEAHGALRLLEAYGYRCTRELGGDFIMLPPAA
jgi:FkbM family methyltransferase